MKLDRVIAVRNNKTVYRDGSRCIKVFYTDHSKADVLNEALNQARMEEESALHVPKVLEVTRVEGKWAIISEFIKGKTLAQLMEEQPEKKNEYLALLVEQQLLVQEQKCQLLNRMKERMCQKISASELEATSRFDFYNQMEDMPKRNKVCHGDMVPSNIIIAEDGTPYIIDWSHATQGNGAADAAHTYLQFLMEGSKEEAQTYLELFSSKTDIVDAESKVKKWVPIVAASQSIKGSEKDREFLLACANNID